VTHQGAARDTTCAYFRQNITRTDTFDHFRFRLYQYKVTLTRKRTAGHWPLRLIKVTKHFSA